MIQPLDEPLIDGGQMEAATTHPGAMVHSGPLDGTPADEAVEAAIRYLEEKGAGVGGSRVPGFETG